MKPIDSNLACPSCQSALQPKVLVCTSCDIKVEGPFQLNEFATLATDDLHFLRIFVRCEGRIRDMESALGLSYPTIRSRLTALKHKLSGGESEDAAALPDTGTKAETGGTGFSAGASTGAEGGVAGAGKAGETPDVAHILARLQAGEIPFDEAMKQIKRARASS
jgi:hypothetical protein